jgi:FeS assembly protein IscX
LPPNTHFWAIAGCHLDFSRSPFRLEPSEGIFRHIMKLTWRDSEEIAWALMDAFPDQDPLKLSFPNLHKMVCELPEFGDKPEASNEKILENIQMAWYSEQK